MLGKIGFSLSIEKTDSGAIAEKLYENFSLPPKPFVHHEKCWMSARPWKNRTRAT
ncbi:MAG: hypothetical protein KDJ87_13415 [Rhizobiaceae bacterium]|nr:hypothetical protein [Rhizobiaceae bacterium]